jgi:hypothetical protein
MQLNEATTPKQPPQSEETHRQVTDLKETLLKNSEFTPSNVPLNPLAFSNPGHQAPQFNSVSFAKGPGTD